MADEQKQIGFRGTEDYRRWLQKTAIDHGVKVQRFIELAIDAYTQSPPGKAEKVQISKSSKTEDDDPLIKDFVEFVKHGDPAIVDIVKNLVATHKTSKKLKEKGQGSRKVS